MSFQKARSDSAKGYSLIEVLLAAFILGTVTVAVTGVALIATQSATSTKDKNVAIQIATAEVEVLRSTKSYDDISAPLPEVDGQDDDLNNGLFETKTVIRNGRTFTIKLFVELIDDPANGTLAVPITEENADFKKVVVKVFLNLDDPIDPDDPKIPTDISGTVTAATFFTRIMAAANAAGTCTAGTLTCLNPNGCIPGTPAACGSDPCPAEAVCPELGEAAFCSCPASGLCSDVVSCDSECETSEDCSEGEQCSSGSCIDEDEPCEFDAECTDGGDVCLNNLCLPEFCLGEVSDDEPVYEVCDVRFDTCSDGIDNDGDGLTDFQDEACQTAAVFHENQLDDDGDGLIDEPDEFALFELVAGTCNRSQCPNKQQIRRLGSRSTFPECGSSGARCGTIAITLRNCATECSDYVNNNDGDGLIDNLDPECLDVNGNYTAKTAFHDNEFAGIDVAVQCSDLADNDNDGKTDLGDPSCTNEFDDDEWCPLNGNNCQEKRGCPAYSTCTDGLVVGAHTGNTGDDCQKAGNCCSDIRPVCIGSTGSCFECGVKPPGLTPLDHATQACPVIVSLNPNDPRSEGDYCGGREPNRCACRSGACAQCVEVNVIDKVWCNQENPDGSNPDVKDICRAKDFSCVECLNNNDCADRADSKNNCRTAIWPAEKSGMCQDECNDGIDNDGDNTADENGFDFKPNDGPIGSHILDLLPDPACADGGTSETPVCSDGLDNDKDGAIDFVNPFGALSDPGCSGPNDNSEEGGPVCNDGFDNDGDGGIDFVNPFGGPKDDECKDFTDPSEEFECVDAFDNDGDGRTNFDDAGCYKNFDVSIDEDFNQEDDDEGDEPQCANGKDDDGDGEIDYHSDANLGDPGCESFFDDTEGPNPECSNEVDDDDDGKIDFDNNLPAFDNDPQCSSRRDDSEGNYECSDNDDNDNDDRKDDKDPGCYISFNVNIAEEYNPNDNDEGDEPACADGLDNDGDGLKDYPDDPGCFKYGDNTEGTAACAPVIDENGLTLALTEGDLGDSSFDFGGGVCDKGIGYVKGTAFADLKGDEGCFYFLDVKISANVERQDLDYDQVSIGYGEPQFTVFAVGSTGEGLGCSMAVQSTTKRILVKGNSPLSLTFDSVDNAYHVGPWASAVFTQDGNGWRPE